MENHSAQKPLAELGGTPPLNGKKSAKTFLKASLTCSAFFSNFSSSLSVPRQSLLSFVVFSFCFSNATECLSSTALISEERASGREIIILLIELQDKFGAIWSKQKRHKCQRMSYVRRKSLRCWRYFLAEPCSPAWSSRSPYPGKGSSSWTWSKLVTSSKCELTTNVSTTNSTVC